MSGEVLSCEVLAGEVLSVFFIMGKPEISQVIIKKVNRKIGQWKVS
jgi:hypothetical protein